MVGSAGRSLAAPGHDGPDARYRAAVAERSDRVLVVDDDPEIRDLLAAALGFSGFTAAVAADAAGALAEVAVRPPDVLVLDVGLPGTDGFALVRTLRERGVAAPVLFLSARVDVADKVRGLSLGGDDYVTKPFSVTEVVARLRALLRRARGQVESDRLQVGDLVFDDAAHVVRRGSRTIELSPTEYRLLRHLIRHRGQVLSKTQLLDQVWGYPSGDGNVVERFVSSLRHKLDTGGPPLLHTVRGFGYVLRDGGG
jgi:two-component system OmpR family response regulator